MFATRLRTVAAVTAAATVSVTAMLVASTPASALVPRTPAAVAALPPAIEDMPSYQPQTFCDPISKPGVVALGALLTATYPDTSVIDIARSCPSESGTSEHKDGRALDWGANYKNPQQVAEVQAVFAWLFAKDAECSTRDGKTWKSLAVGDISAATGLLDLWVAGHRAWVPTTSTGGGCNATGHTYQRILTFATTAPLQLWISDPTHPDDTGSLKVVLQRV